MKTVKVRILGALYTIEEKTMQQDGFLGECDGYCDKSTRLIRVAAKKPDCQIADFERYQRKVLRHEIIHAFLYESGLEENFEHANKWGHDETMVDWFANQFPKILTVFEKVGCLY